MCAMLKDGGKRLSSVLSSLNLLYLRRFCSSVTPGSIHPTAIVHPNAVLGCFNRAVFYCWIVGESWKWLPIVPGKSYIRKYRSWGALCFVDVSFVDAVVPLLVMIFQGVLCWDVTMSLDTMPWSVSNANT